MFDIPSIMSMLSQRYNVPKSMNNPQEIIQFLLNNGKISQQQVNNAVMQMQNDPKYRNMIR